MTENEIISILSKFSVELILLAVLTVVFTSIIKKALPATMKNFIHLIPFILGILIYACYSFLVLKELSVTNIIKSGTQVGGIAILIYAFIKQLSRKNSNAKNAITDILTGFINETDLSGAVNRIIKEYNESKASTTKNSTTTLKNVTKIIAETSSVNETDSATLGSLVVKTLDTILKTTETDKTTK